MNEIVTAPTQQQQNVDSNYAQALVDVLQKNCNDHFAKIVQLEAKITVQEKQIENLVNENVKLKTADQTASETNDSEETQEKE